MNFRVFLLYQKAIFTPIYNFYLSNIWYQAVLVMFLLSTPKSYPFLPFIFIQTIVLMSFPVKYYSIFIFAIKFIAFLFTMYALLKF
jgi:hypothetical protein